MARLDMRHVVQPASDGPRGLVRDSLSAAPRRTTAHRAAWPRCYRARRAHTRTEGPCERRTKELDSRPCDAAGIRVFGLGPTPRELGLLARPQCAVVRRELAAFRRG